MVKSKFAWMFGPSAGIDSASEGVPRAGGWRLEAVDELLRLCLRSFRFVSFRSKVCCCQAKVRCKSQIAHDEVFVVFDCAVRPATGTRGMVAGGYPLLPALHLTDQLQFL